MIDAGGISRAELERAAARGIISPQQLAALVALSAEAPGASEARHGVNAATVAYWAGGIAVLFAFGWFLIARWDVLGPGGVLALTLVYAVLFVWSARVFQQHGFSNAATVATLLSVATVPLITWAVLALAGWWYPYPATGRAGVVRSPAPTLDDLSWLPIELTTILAALVAISRRHAGILALPIAVSLAYTGVHVMRLFFDPDVQSALGGRISLFVAVILLGIGYLADVRADDDADYSIWFYAVGLVMLTLSILQFWSESARIAAHGTLALSALFVVVAVRMRRPVFLAAAFLGFLGYLAYLTFEAFPNALSLPIVLATAGLATIVVTVWLQRKFPGMVRRTVSEDRKPLPGARLALAGATVIAIVMIVTDVPAAHARLAERYQRGAVARAIARNAAKRGSLHLNRRRDSGR